MNNIDDIMQEIINKSKSKIRDSFNEILDEVYCDVSPFYEDDLFINMRTQIINQLKGYKSKYSSGYDWSSIRKEILKENYDEIINDLNQDNLVKIKELENSITYLQNLLNRG